MLESDFTPPLPRHSESSSKSVRSPDPSLLRLCFQVNLGTCTSVLRSLYPSNVASMAKTGDTVHNSQAMTSPNLRFHASCRIQQAYDPGLHFILTSDWRKPESALSELEELSVLKECSMADRFLLSSIA